MSAVAVALVGGAPGAALADLGVEAWHPGGRHVLLGWRHGALPGVVGGLMEMKMRETI